MIGPVQSAWLFTRGTQSVRIVHVGRGAGPQRLLVHGPGAEAAVYESDDPIDRIHCQTELERRLVVEGYHLEHFASGERRNGGDRRDGRRASDRRRLLQPVV
jgi:hypothetical protein